MSSAPALKVIEGGRASAPPAPALPPASDAMRLFPAIVAAERGTFAKVVALSLMLHGAIVVAALGLNLFGSDPVGNAGEDIILLDGVDVVLLDQAPSPPSPAIETPQIEDAVSVEPDITIEPAPIAEPELVDPLPAKPKNTIEDKPTAPVEAENLKAVSETEAVTIVDDTIAAEPISTTKIQAEILPESKSAVDSADETAVELLAEAPNKSTTAKSRASTPPKSSAGGTAKKRKSLAGAGLSKYQSRLVSHLRRYRRYPDAARRRRVEGTATVSFTINRRGRVVGASLARSTGHKILDREALAMVRRASPFPAIPPALGKSQITVRAPIRFDTR